jgi:DNA-binding MarR family transcriptional regulator
VPLPSDGFDRLLEHRLRLAICALLSRNDAMSFSRFKELLGETDGNLGAQLRTLEEAGYIGVRKEFRDRKPVTWYSLRPKGRKALISHVEALEALIGSIDRE